jgi:hypothetical protein
VTRRRTKSESDEKQEEEHWFCAHSQNGYISFISRDIIPHVLKSNFIGGKRMKKLITICALLSIVSVASATIINFDDLTTPYSGGGISDWGFVPSSYAGLEWTGFEVTNGASYMSAYSNTYSAPSAPNFAYNGDDGYLITSVNADPFDFLSADFTSFVQNDAYQSFSAMSITLNGYVDNILVDTLIVNNLPTTGFTTVTANFMGIDELQIQSDAYGHYWGMDNFTVNIPEPVTFVLLGLGALALRRRK